MKKRDMDIVPQRMGNVFVKKGYGGEDCHPICSIGTEWQKDFKENSSKLCYYGSEHCDSYCQYETGYVLEDNICISE